MDTHRPTLQRLSEEGDQTAVTMRVDKSRRATLAQLIAAFRQRPAEQREAIREYLIGSRGIEAGRTTRGSLYSLRWQNDEIAGALGFDWGLIWQIEFTYGAVTLTFHSPPWVQGRVQDRIIGFMQQSPIDRSQPPGRSSKYPMRKEQGYIIVYENRLLNEEELMTLRFQESLALLRRRVDVFFAPGSDHERIVTYFKCLAFDPRAPEPQKAHG